MNATAKALADTNWIESNVFSLSLLRKKWWFALLLAAVLISAFSIVYVKTLNRRMFSELQTTFQTRDQLQVQWGQLLLEQSTWSTQARIQRIAEQNLQMVTPLPNHTILIRERV